MNPDVDVSSSRGYAASDSASSPADRPLVRLLGKVLLAVLALVAVFRIFQPFLHAQPWQPLYEDDFFYYLKVAANLATGHGSTFNGIVPTNGYHPLWLLIITAVYKVNSSGAFLHGFLTVAMLVATAATFWITWSLLRRSGLAAVSAGLLAGYVAVFGIHLFGDGMETTLAAPMALAVLLAASSEERWKRTLPEGLGLGLLLSTAILARLDAGLLVLLLGVGWLATPALRNRLTRPQLIGVVLGLLPVFAYLAINHTYFHTWMPVSGMSKQLKSGWAPSAATWHSIAQRTTAQKANYLLSLLGLPLLLVAWRSLRAHERVIVAAGTLFPIAQLSVLTLRSDWKLWAWYYYVFFPALAATFYLLGRWHPSRRLLESLPVVGVLALVVSVQVVKTHREGGGMMGMYSVAERLAAFDQTHPGVYAMGDRAGLAGYELRDPMVQTEGLVMDRGFLELMKRETPLREVLRHYGVRYYVATAEPSADGCLHASEPFQAGPRSPHMRSNFCGAPVARFVTPGEDDTFIYDLDVPAAAAGAVVPAR